MKYAGMLRLVVCAVVVVASWGPHQALATTFAMTGPAGGGQGHNNHQPGLGLNFIVATQGVFPSRNSGLADISTLRSEPFIGQITMFAGTFAPRGWEFADGQEIPIAQNQALFALLGTTYGGDGRTNFKLPDLRGRSPMHQGSGPGLTPLSLGEQVGVDEVILTESEIPAHSHPLTPPLGGGTITDTMDIGGGQAHTNLKPGLGINFNMPLNGLFPSRNSGLGEITTLGSDPVIGEINMFAGNFAPRGTVPTDGRLLPISQNQAAFSILGTTYGGNGRTEFAVPDLRGRMPVHEGQGVGLSNYVLGEKGGVEEVTLTTAELPSHDHPGVDPTGDTGGDQAHENVQPYQAVNFIISLQGTFPSRNADLGDIVQNTGEPFLGEVQMFAGNFAPRGWAFADGQELQIAQHTALFSILGTTYGGDGRTTFNLPDLRSRVPVHVGDGGGPLRDWSLGEKFGEESVQLSLSKIPSHTHSYQVPEPSTTVLALIGLVGLVRRQRR